MPLDPYALIVSFIGIVSLLAIFAVSTADKRD